MTADQDGGQDRALLLEIQDSFAIIRLNRPSERNSLSISTLQEIDVVLDKVFGDSSLSTIIFSGSGESFSAGANIRELESLDSHTALEFASRGQNLFQKVAGAEQVTIAAVNGFCMGGGLDFALSCDARVASKDALFGHPGAQLGIITGWGGTQRLPRLIGSSRALEMFASGRRITSKEAVEIGLIDRICDPVLEGAIKFGNEIANRNVRRN